MGLSGPTIYPDSCIAIYLVEEHRDFANQIESLIESTDSSELIISDLSVMECLVGPLRNGNAVIEKRYKEWFDKILVVPIPGIAFRDAARLRADNPSIKTPDALHVATAVHYRCDELWTNDDRLSKVAGIVRKVV